MSEAERGNMITPNMLSVCVDEAVQGEVCGRMYCCYGKEAFSFQNEHMLILGIERFVNDLNYPQSSVNFRSFHVDEKATMQHLMEPHSPSSEEVKALLEQRGKLATLLVYVRYRQNATWQGTVVHQESGQSEDFRSELEFLEIINHAVEGAAGAGASSGWRD